MGFGSKNKKKGSKKADKKKNKKSKSTTHTKGKDKKHHDKKGHHGKKGSHGPPKYAPGHAGAPPPPQPKQKHRAPGHVKGGAGGGGGEMPMARTPPYDANGQWAAPPPQQQQQARPGAPPGAARAPPGMQRQPQPQQPVSAPAQLQQQPGGPPGGPKQPPSGPPQQQQRSGGSQSMSAESMAMMVGPQIKQQPPKPQPQQKRGPPPPQQQAPAPARPAAAPPARPPPQQQSPRQQQQPSPDLDRTEKKSSKKGGGAVNKISKFLDIKFSTVVDLHRKFLGTLPNSVSRAAFDDNLCLNRFEDVICIDQTRVLFSDSSLYLNANWVTIEPGKKPDDPPKKMAIVAQLPLPECAVAFWTMVAENDIKGILLFCDDNEFLTFGADRIFPVNKTTVAISPRITVTHTHRLAVTSEWTMNVYLMCRGDVRKYVHVHCYAWQGDDQIKLQNLWQLESVFRKYSSPHVYMSSAGVGRASTFAALKMVHARMHDETCKEVLLHNCIVSLREHRLHSIQSLKQSTTLHAACIQHIIDCPAFEKLEQDQRVRSFAEQFKEYMATEGKE